MATHPMVQTSQLPLSYPPRVSLAQLPTPLQPLDRLHAQTGGPRIWVKRDDMTGATLSGNKVRKLEFLLAKAQQEGCGAVVTSGGLQSNHCRATALAAAQLGMRCHLILRGEPGDKDKRQGNLFLDELAGASIGFHSLRDYLDNLDALFEQAAASFAEQGIRTLKIPTGGSNGVGIWGYLAAYDELLNDFAHHGIDPAAIVCATGSGGTQAGLTLGAALDNNRRAVIGINVCDDEAYFLNKVQEDIHAWRDAYPDAVTSAKVDNMPDVLINVIDGYVGNGYGKADEAVFETIRNLARLEGIVLDPVYTGKAFNGLLNEIEKGRFAGSADIVFIHTGGVFGLYPYAQQLVG